MAHDPLYKVTIDGVVVEGLSWPLVLEYLKLDAKVQIVERQS